MTPDNVSTLCGLAWGLFAATAVFLAGAHYMYRDEGSCNDRLSALVPTLLGAGSGIAFIACCIRIVVVLTSGQAVVEAAG
jgi:hypothetical protein